MMVLWRCLAAGMTICAFWASAIAGLHYLAAIRRRRGNARKPLYLAAGAMGAFAFGTLAGAILRVSEAITQAPWSMRDLTGPLFAAMAYTLAMLSLRWEFIWNPDKGNDIERVVLEEEEKHEDPR